MKRLWLLSLLMFGVMVQAQTMVETFWVSIIFPPAALVR